MSDFLISAGNPETRKITLDTGWYLEKRHESRGQGQIIQGFFSVLLVDLCVSFCSLLNLCVVFARCDSVSQAGCVVLKEGNL